MIDEIQAGDKDAAERRMREIDDLKVLEATIEAEQLTDVIIKAGVGLFLKKQSVMQHI